jgi:hypothetical protein
LTAESDRNPADANVGDVKSLAWDLHHQTLDKPPLAAHNTHAILRRDSVGDFPPGQVDMVHVVLAVALRPF